MGSWRTLAETIRQGEEVGHNRHNGHDRPGTDPIVPIVPNVPADPSRVLRFWHSKLSPLDEHSPPAGFDPARWRVLKDDSWWLYENFASQAVRTGWSALDLFGVLPADHMLGGLVARLQGARNLKMAGPKANWSSWGVPDWTCRGAGDDLVPSGLRPIWEFAHEAIANAKRAGPDDSNSIG